MQRADEPSSLSSVSVSSFLLEVKMDILIARLEDLNVSDALEIVADCVDFGRLPLLADYMTARESLHDMEVETYVR